MYKCGKGIKKKVTKICFSETYHLTLPRLQRDVRLTEHLHRVVTETPLCIQITIYYTDPTKCTSQTIHLASFTNSNNSKEMQ